MAKEEISASAFIREYLRELHNKNAAVFAGAGLSMASGYVDWKGLLKNIIQDLGLDPDHEEDLVTLAQYHCNQAGGNKAKLTQTIFDRFSLVKTPTENHRLLARLPIYTYWTTNYDKLIEKALEEAKKTPDVKHSLKQLAVTRLDRDVVVYKMHGDVDHAADAVISKDDYEAYPVTMAAFSAALRGDLIEKTFLFLGFSFTDPNIDYILSRVRVQYEKHQRHHYCIQKRATKAAGEADEAFTRRELKQDYFLRDLKRFGILTVLVDDYPAITGLLREVVAGYKRSSVLVSGAAHEYAPWTQPSAEAFLHKLGNAISARGNRVITGFGLGVGSAVINGSLDHLSQSGKTATDEHLVMRPFPQVATGAASLSVRWTDYRKAMIDFAGVAVFVFGNKLDPSAKIQLSGGMREEFDLCVKAGVLPLPIGATGYMSAELWKEVDKDFAKYFPSVSPEFKKNFQVLGDPARSGDEILLSLTKLLDELQRY